MVIYITNVCSSILLHSCRKGEILSVMLSFILFSAVLHPGAQDASEIHSTNEMQALRWRYTEIILNKRALRFI